jgi:HEAT repeat protein
MRRTPVVKSQIIKASVGPAKRTRNVVNSVIQLVVGVVIGAVSVLIFVGGFVIPTKSSPAQRQPTRGAGQPTVVLTGNYSAGSSPVEKTYNATVVKDRSVPSLLQLLTSDLEEQREEAAYALEFGSRDYRFLNQIVPAGGIPILRGIIENATETNEDVVIKAVALLASCMTGHHSIRMELVQGGFLRHFLTLAKDGFDDVKVPAAQALLGVLSYLTESEYSETLSIVTGLVWNGTEGVRDQAVSWLYNRYRHVYISGEEESEPGPEVILALVHVLKVGSDQAKMRAARVLARPTFGGVHRATIVKGGGVPLLVPLLTNRTVQSEVLTALLLFTTEYPEALAQVASVGLPILQRIVEQGSGVYEGDSWFVGHAYTLCVNLARDPEVAAQMVQAGMLPLWGRLSQEGQGEAKRQAGRVVAFLSRVTAAQGQSQGQRNVPPPNSPSIRRRDP